MFNVEIKAMLCSVHIAYNNRLMTKLQLHFDQMI